MFTVFQKLFGGDIQIPYESGLDGTHCLKVMVTDPIAEPENRIEQLLSTNGDGTGVTEMATNPAVYTVTPSVGEICVLRRINMYIECDAGDTFDAAKYGGTLALANGIIVSIEDGDGTIVTLTPQPVKKIGHWDLVAGIDMLFTDFPTGGAADLGAVRWTFSRGGGSLVLNGDEGQFLKYNVQDNLGAGGAGLISHMAQVQGKKFSSG